MSPTSAVRLSRPGHRAGEPRADWYRILLSNSSIGFAESRSCELPHIATQFGAAKGVPLMLGRGSASALAGPAEPITTTSRMPVRRSTISTEPAFQLGQALINRRMAASRRHPSLPPSAPVRSVHYTTYRPQRASFRRPSKFNSAPTPHRRVCASEAKRRLSSA